MTYLLWIIQALLAALGLLAAFVGYKRKQLML
jgi:hypothetical protein